MSWYLYDKNGFVDQIATYGGLLDIELLNITPLNKVIAKGAIETDEEREAVLKAIAPYPQLAYLADIINGAGGLPLLITDQGGDSRIDKFHDESEYTELEEEDTIMNVEDAKRVYEKYVGKWPTGD